MNSWYDSEEARKGEAALFHAERCAAQGRHAEAEMRYLTAAEAYRSAAEQVPATHPNTRGDLAVAATACFARAGHLLPAAETAQFFLDRPGLAPASVRRLQEMLQAYALEP